MVDERAAAAACDVGVLHGQLGPLGPRANPVAGGCAGSGRGYNEERQHRRGQDAAPGTRPPLDAAPSPPSRLLCRLVRLRSTVGPFSRPGGTLNETAPVPFRRRYCIIALIVAEVTPLAGVSWSDSGHEQQGCSRGHIVTNGSPRFRSRDWCRARKGRGGSAVAVAVRRSRTRGLAVVLFSPARRQRCRGGARACSRCHGDAKHGGAVGLHGFSVRAGGRLEPQESLRVGPRRRCPDPDASWFGSLETFASPRSQAGVVATSAAPGRSPATFGVRYAKRAPRPGGVLSQWTWPSPTLSQRRRRLSSLPSTSPRPTAGVSR